MKRFSAREFALLCVPVAVVAGVGWWASRRPTPKPSYVGPQLQFRDETPKALQAFDGVQQALTISIGKDSKGAQFSAFGQPKSWLHIKTPQNTETWYSSGTGTLPVSGVSMASENNQKYSILIKQVPQGALTAGFSGQIVNDALRPAVKPIFVKRQWNVSKSKFKPFDFNLPRASLVKLTSATISTVSATQLAARFTFALQGMAMNEKTTLDNQFDEKHGLSFGYSMNGKVNAPKARVCECYIMRKNSTMGVGAAPMTIELSGRVSADNRWPLAFSIEPFDFKTAKVGQQLKFKSWPAPLPPDVPLKH